MKIYLVGGAVRDKLLGLPVKERDWVVVGATVTDMLKQGFKQVGKEFPVFLHPKTGEEYALARMERKIQAGYKGFTFDASPTVTLEEDLLRRDLTINAMAQDEDGAIIDPYGGQKDLQQHVLRHVSSAFSEDPVRILRVGRFLARYASLGFTLAPETITLMQQMTTAGEVDALVAERVWKELERALAEKNPEQFFATLAACGALAKLFPAIEMDGRGMHALSAATALSRDTAVRFAALMHALPHPKQVISELATRYRLPNAYRRLAELTALHYQTALTARQLPAEALLTLFSVLDIYRRDDRFQQFLTTCCAIAPDKFDREWLSQAAAAAKQVDIKRLLAAGLEGEAFAVRLKEERKLALGRFLQDST
jgi:tRNA nucleotidyltransferase (CCA-adding enzyme)